MAVKRIVIFASGRGSNFSALTDAIQRNEIQGAEVVGLLCNKKEAFVLKEASKRNVPQFLIESKAFKKDGHFDRAAYEKEILKTLEKLKPDYICLAGYMLLLGKEIIQKFPNRILNIHPSLLPKYKGLHAQRQALEAKEKETGCTVHIVTEALDDGPVIAQSKIPIFAQDCEESLSQRLVPTEHQTYIAALKKLLS